MAEGGGTGKISVGTGVDPVFKFYCEFCNDEGLYIEASGHCTQCDEFLCDSCVTHHKRNRLSQDHEVLYKENILGYNPPAPNRVRKDITTMCKEHKGERVKYYCKSHDVLACCSCIITDHKACANTVNITDASQSIFDDTEYTDFKKNLKSLETQILNIGTKSRDQSATSIRCCKEATEAMGRFRNDINSLFDDIEANLKAHIDSIKMKDLANMETINTTCSDAQKKIDKLASELESLQSDNRVCQTYIRIKETAGFVKDIDRQLAEAEEKNTISTYTFLQNTKLSEFMNGTNVLGMLCFDAKSASFVQDINVKSKYDEECSITGSAVLPENKLVIVDYKNCKVNLVDTLTMNIISTITVPKYPFDVTDINGHHVAVTIPDQNTILVLKVTNNLVKEEEIAVNGRCYGIAHSKNEIIVTNINPPKLEILDLQGNVNSKIEYENGNKLFRRPQYVCVSSDGDTLYVSDHGAGRVVSLSRSGSVKAIYRDSNLIGPAKVCLDQYGRVLVCSGNSRSVHVLSPDCIKIREILSQREGLTSYNYSVSYCQHSDRIYIGMEWCNDVKVYRIIRK